MDGQGESGGLLAPALIVVLVGSAIFAFGSFGARAKLPGSRALQAIGAGAVLLAIWALVVIA